MNYRNRTNTRNFKKIILNIFSLFRFDSISINFSGKIIMIGNILLLISLFFPWLLKTDENYVWDSFNAIGGNIGFFSIFLILFISFIIIFLRKTEKMKLSLDISFKDYLIIILSGIFVIIIGVIYISFINGLTIFFKDILIGKGVILYILSGIVITIGGFLKKRDYNNKEYESFINETSKENISKNNKSNMQLPF